MYADPAHIRKHRVNLSLNDAEARLVQAAAEVAGVQPSTYMRELVLESLMRFEQELALEQGQKRHAQK